MAPPRLAPIGLSLLLLAGGAAAGEVTIYRCTDRAGHESLRDTPCRPGERQQARSMQRPRDPPPRPAAPAPAVVATERPLALPPRVIVTERPRPLYECVTPDGDRYTSDTDAGQPRRVPLWTLGYPSYPDYPVVAPPMVPHRAGRRDRAPERNAADRLVFDNIGRPTPHPPRHRPGPPRVPPAVGLALAPGAWIRDECHPLPPAEVCARLRDRRYELGRAWNSALQSERDRIDDEQRALDARLAADCGSA